MEVTKAYRRERIKKRIRKVVHGDAQAPRMSIFRSNKEIYVQLVDDVARKTLLASSSKEKALAGKKVTKIEQAKMVGKAIAEKAIKAGFKEVKFDRNGFLYHGRVKSLADAAREGGLEF